MTILYIGQYSPGTTSKMRADILNDILRPINFDVIDIHVPFYRTHKLWRSIGFRYKMGPLISTINKYIMENLKRNSYDLIWVDKAVYISKRTTLKIRKSGSKTVHFSPDPAFKFHYSSHFKESGKFYDYLITTKSFELKYYHKYFGEEKTLLTTQGFDIGLHRPTANEKKYDFIFIGHCEKDRELVLQQLLNHGVHVTLAGIKWENFVNRNTDNKNLNFIGNGVYGQEYVDLISEAKIAWGALSKWIPEKHTTRTFEIPACGTALLTELNDETSKFFPADAAIFYQNNTDIVDKVLYYLNNSEKLDSVTSNGLTIMNSGKYDYKSIIHLLLKKIELL